MATAHELLQAGHLGAAIQELTQQVKARPADVSLRVALFEALCFEGAFERANKQLDVIAGQSGGMKAELAVQVYRALIRAEQVRKQVFEGEALPKFLITPPAYVSEYVVIATQLRKKPGEALARLAEAETQTPALPGRYGDDHVFSSFRDSDDRVAPILEIFHGADYIWLPFEQIKSIEVSEPKSQRDLLWARVKVETHEQSVGDVFVPALYVGSESHADEQIRLGRKTETELFDNQLVCGAGLRMFLVDNKEVSLFDIRNLEFDRVAEQAAST